MTRITEFGHNIYATPGLAGELAQAIGFMTFKGTTNTN